MKNIHYKSDFDFLLRLKDCRGEEVGWPGFAWSAKFWTATKANALVASCTGGECVNCYNDDGKIHIVADGHGLSPGKLNMEFTAHIPNGVYPDGDERVVLAEPLDITLCFDKCEYPASAEAEAMLPYVKGQKGDKGETGIQGQKGDKGDPFTYDDFTEAQKAELMRPATDAATTLAGKEREFENAEKKREADTRTAIGAAETAATAASSAATYTRGVGDDYADAVEEAKVKVFRDLWNAACGEYGRYNEQTGFYELNGITDIGYEEAQRIYAAGPITTHYTTLRYAYAKIRTNLPIQCGSWYFGTSSSQRFWLQSSLYNSDIEVFNVCTRPYDFCVHAMSDVAHVGLSAPKLRKIMGNLDCAKLSEAAKSYNLFGGCPLLEEVNIMLLRSDLLLNEAPRLNLASLQFLVVQKHPLDNNPFTVTVHPDVYAKLTDESNTEWHKVLTDAAAKNISFATL